MVDRIKLGFYPVAAGLKHKLVKQFYESVDKLRRARLMVLDNAHEQLVPFEQEVLEGIGEGQPL